ncbi:MAG: exodeoxyribonuclease VII large subunit [bacterium]
MNERKIFSVFELTTQIKLILESAFPSIWVCGEVSNIKTASSGYTYFTLKDALSQIDCVVFKKGLKIPKDGEHINVYGEISVYAKRGTYQIIVSFIEPVGKGLLWQKFEELKERLKKEGLFEAIHKKPIPFLPERIGIITSPTGAAIKDLLKTLPDIEIIIYGVKVQGEGAAGEIASAIIMMNKLEEKPDVLIVGRGGGSLEDLWSFNEEIVARAIFASEIPVISAVGHETDYTISDMVADIRAATPTQAGEILKKIREDISQRMKLAKERLIRAMGNIASKQKMRIFAISSSYPFKKPFFRIEQERQEIDDLSQSLERAISAIFSSLKIRLARLEVITSLSPEAILKRGYSITYKDGKVIKNAQDVAENDRINIRLYKGGIDANVIKSQKSKQAHLF